MNTFRERLQALIEQVQACYDEVGVLRDYADRESEKASLNKARGLLSASWEPMQRLDNNLSDGHASMMTQGKGLCK